jgi:hypothetical protein
LPELGFFRKEENSEQKPRSWFGDLFEIKKTECTWHINGKLCATAPHRILGVEIGFWVSRGGAVRDEVVMECTGGVDVVVLLICGLMLVVVICGRGGREGDG